MSQRLRGYSKLLVIIGLSLLPGCARTPRTPTAIAPKRQLIVDFSLAAPADPNYFYFVAFDIDGDEATGPVPVISWSDAMGTGWGIINTRPTPMPPPSYVEYHQRRFNQYLNGQLQGPPFRAEVLEGGQRIRLSLDLDLITTSASLLSMNIITVDTLFPPSPPGVRDNYDALGPSGNDFVSFPLLNQTIHNPGTETAGDCPEPSLDLVDWSVEVRISP